MPDMKKLLSILSESTVAGSVASTSTPIGSSPLKRSEDTIFAAECDTECDSMPKSSPSDFGLWKNSKLIAREQVGKHGRKKMKVDKTQMYPQLAEAVEPEQSVIDATRDSRLGRERNAGLNEPDEKPTSHKEVDFGTWHFTVDGVPQKKDGKVYYSSSKKRNDEVLAHLRKKAEESGNSDVAIEVVQGPVKMDESSELSVDKNQGVAEGLESGAKILYTGKDKGGTVTISYEPDYIPGHSEKYIIRFDGKVKSEMPTLKSAVYGLTHYQFDTFRPNLQPNPKTALEQGVAEGLESEDIMANSLGKFAYYAITAKGKDEPQNPYPAGTQSAADFDEGYEAAYDGQTRNLLAAPVENLVRFYNVRDRLHLLKQGVAEGSLNEFAPDGFNGGDDDEGFNPEIAKMAQEDGFTKGAGLADGATLERAMAINYWHSQHGGMYKQYFAKGFKAGRMDKIRHNNKQYNLNLKLMKDGSIRHGEQGVAEGLADVKNIDPGELAGQTVGGIAGYMAGDALGGPMVGFGAAGVGSAIGGALAKEGRSRGVEEDASLKKVKREYNQAAKDAGGDRPGAGKKIDDLKKRLRQRDVGKDKSIANEASPRFVDKDGNEVKKKQSGPSPRTPERELRPGDARSTQHGVATITPTGLTHQRINNPTAKPRFVEEGSEITEEMIADRLKSELDLFKKGTKSKSKDISKKPEDKEVQPKKPTKKDSE